MALSIANYDPAKRLGAKDGQFQYGGVVTQLTSRSTGVTLNALSGQITTSSASLAAETAAVFTVTDSYTNADDAIIATVAGGSNGGNTTVQVTTVANGSFQITVANQNAAAGTAETGAILINFVIWRAAQVS